MDLSRINGLDLFSGIGGISLALQDYVRPVAYCEIDPYCQGVLLSRMVSGDLPEAPIWDDIKTLRIQSFDHSIDILYGGFPCQDISIAGNGKGLAGQRSGLCYEIFRLANEIKPRWLFLENVPAITTRGGLEVVKEIAKMGYDCRWITITASSVGALHKRERWFLLAHSSSQGLQRFGRWEGVTEKEESKSSGSSEIIPDSRCISPGSEEKSEWPYNKSSGCSGFWEAESRVGKLADGIHLRVDKLRALGNSVVPQQVKKAFEILMGIDENP